jgi:orotate phosphoribosyltransferase
MQENEILQEFKDAEAILKGHFILSSGLHSDTYLQCARVLMDPKRAEKLCAALAKKVKEKLGENAIDLIVAPAMGGVVVGYEMGRQLGVTTIFCERVDGKFEIRRGFNIESGARILVVEDVVTTGKSSLETMDCIKQYGGVVVAEASLIDRSNGKADMGIPLISLLTLEVQTYAEDSIPEHLSKVPAVKPGSRWLNKKAG